MFDDRRITFAASNRGSDAKKFHNPLSHSSLEILTVGATANSATTLRKLLSIPGSNFEAYANFCLKERP